MDSRALKLGADDAHSRFGGAAERVEVTTNHEEVRRRQRSYERLRLLGSAMHPVGGAARPAIFEMRACDRERPLTAATIVTFHARHHSDTALAYERQLEKLSKQLADREAAAAAPVSRARRKRDEPS